MSSSVFQQRLDEVEAQMKSVKEYYREAVSWIQQTDGSEDKLTEHADSLRERSESLERQEVTIYTTEGTEGRDLSEFDDLDSFRSTPVEKRQRYVEGLIERHQPISVRGLGEKLFGYKPGSGTPEYQEVSNRVHDLVDEDRVECLSRGRGSRFRVVGQMCDPIEGASSLDDLDPGPGHKIICVNCEEPFDTMSESKSHRREEGHDNWILYRLLKDGWDNERTIKRIVEKKTAKGGEA